MKRAVATVLVLVALIVATVWWFATQGAGRAVVTVTGSARHIVTVTLSTPRSGDRTIILAITDRGGIPYAVPSLPCTAVLPAMGYASPPMVAVAQPVRGTYRVDNVPLMAPGGWQFFLTISDAGDEEEVMVPLSIAG